MSESKDLSAQIAGRTEHLALEERLAEQLRGGWGQAWPSDI